jgi:hypothetical protein
MSRIPADAGESLLERDLEHSAPAELPATAGQGIVGLTVVEGPAGKDSCRARQSSASHGCAWSSALNAAVARGVAVPVMSTSISADRSVAATASRFATVAISMSG